MIQENRYDSGPNAKGRRDTNAFIGGSVQYTFDARGRVTSEGRWAGNGYYTTSYTYDQADRVATVTLPTLEVITNTYNGRGLPYGVSSSAVGTVATGAAYNRLGKMTGLNLGSNVRTEQEYWGVEHLGAPAQTQFGKLYRQYTYRTDTSAVHQDLRYTWDVAGNMTQREDALHVTVENFTYDFLDRLIGTSGLYTQTYTYDGLDNITFRTGVGNYYYANSSRPHLLTGTDLNPSAYAYDANGNMTARPGQTLLWIAEDRLGTVNAAGGGEIETHMYDPEGFRWLKSDASGTTRYINRWYERNVTTGGAKVHYWLGDRLVAERDDAVVRYMSLDSLESPTAVSASDGTSSWRAYHPWGDMRTSSGSFGTDRGFTGQYADATSGLSFYRGSTAVEIHARGEVPFSVAIFMTPCAGLML